MKLLVLLLLTLSTLLASIGEVTVTKGSSTLLRANNTVDVQKGIKIELQDLLTTTASSKVQVILDDDTVITVGPNSEYLFEKYQEEGEQEVLMQLKRGFFKTLTGKIGKIAPQRFKIKTKAATIGIRGTQFMAHVRANDEEEIGCIQGEITVWTTNETYSVKAGMMLTYKEKKWNLQEMDMHVFAPVMIGMNLNKDTKAHQNFYMPDLTDSYMLEEQILNSYTSSPNFDPFTFDFSSGVPTTPFSP